MVDGLLPSEGRLQININNTWHSVCTNSNNWTQIDAKVICNQMGYKEGHFYKWFARFNDSRQLMLEQPSCLGEAKRIDGCTGWSARQVGSGICDYHADIGIQCTRHSHTGSIHWAGIKFDEAEYEETWLGSLDGRMKRRVSKSKLVNVDIVYAGSPATSVAAIEVLGIPPQMKNSTVRYSLSSGINITNVNDAVVIEDSTFVENNGHGIFVNSSWGQVNLHRVHVEANSADGIRYNLQKDLQTGETFCHFPNLGENQVYPVRITHDQTSDHRSTSECCQSFRFKNYDRNGGRLTAHFTHIMVGQFEGPEEDRHLASDGWIDVWDGYKNRLISRFTLQNDTKVPSVTANEYQLRICYHPAILKKVLFTVVVVADFGRAYDLNITKSYVAGNNGRGIWVENQRAGTIVNHTIVANNSYVSGIHVHSEMGPLGDFIVNNSYILTNKGDGLNVTLQGAGYFHVDRSEIRGNEKRGIALWFNESALGQLNQNSSLISQLTHSLIEGNGGTGFLHGNVCHSIAALNISMNRFYSNLDAIEICSCTKRSPEAHSIAVLISNNLMSHNRRLAIKMSTVSRIKKSSICYNTFTGHNRGVIYINSQDDIFDDPYFESLPVDMAISDNVFTANTGLFVVNIGVQDNSHKQSIYFTRNKLHDNRIQQPHPTLNPRSRVAAVVVVSSNNTIVTKNNLINPLSNYEIGVHLESHSKIINASLNYFGQLSYDSKTAQIYDRIFDRKNRYNLAQVEFLQYRTTESDFETPSMLSYDRERDKFMPFQVGNTIGGEVAGFHRIGQGIFNVVKDIFVRPGSTLTISEGATLNFDQSIGMMVQGKLECFGKARDPIRFSGSNSHLSPFNKPSFVPSVTFSSGNDINQPEDNLGSSGSNFSSPVDPLSGNSTGFAYAPASDVYSSVSLREEKIPSQPHDMKKEDTSYSGNSRRSESPQPDNSSISLQPHPGPHSWTFRQRRQASALVQVRLVNGKSSSTNSIEGKGIEGRLEVLIDDRWGGVCSYGFDILDASIACQQMGYALNDHDWLLEKSEYSSSDAIILSNLKCTHFDTDITSCESEKLTQNDFYASCPSDVGIKCYTPTWAGIRLGMGAETATIEHTIIENAGLLDYATNSFKPALQIDFNRHRIYNLTSKDNSDSGIGFMWNDIFIPDRENLKVKSSQVLGNGNHGIVTRSQGLTVVDSVVKNNRGSGFNYNPLFTRKEQLDLISWVTASTDQDFITIQPSEVRTNFFLDRNRRSWFIHVKRNPDAHFFHTFNLTTEIGHAMDVMVLNPIFNDASDNLTISNAAMNLQWDLRRNLSSFPLLQSAFILNVTYDAGGNPQGNILLYVSIKRLPRLIDHNNFIPSQREENRILKSIIISDCTFSRNGRAISSNHYNRDIGIHNEYYHRYSNESIVIANNLIERSKKEALFVNSPFYDPLEFSLAEINFTLINNSIVQNNRGIVQFSRDIRNSNNLFHWTINQTQFTHNDGTGIMIRLPYVWQFNENFTHSVSINHNLFVQNNNFQFVIDGHYTRLNVTHNTFKKNTCPEGLVKIAGMEKALLFEENSIENNQGPFMVLFDIQSHADKFGLVPANVRRNTIQLNKDILIDLPSDGESVEMYQPRSYTVAVKGVQYINITRNLFQNPNLQYEFLAAVITGSLDSRLNVRENWWGTAEQESIKRKMFDFDDWNSYAIAEFSPFLGSSDHGAALFTFNEGMSSKGHVELGGLIRKNLFLSKRSTPYRINRDLTVMPGVTLHINKGVEIEFFPSIGILVLGEMIVRGTDSEPVVMKPFPPVNELFRYKREDVPYEVVKNDASDITNVRLCHSTVCNEGKSNGFLEVYNETTKQWISVCDSRFTERNAQVVCNQLKYSKLNVHVERGRRLDMGPIQISQVKYWPEPFECSGTESSVGKCDIRLNGFGNHTHSCTHDGESFVFIDCGKELKDARQLFQYWGGIRFARDTFEHNYIQPHTHISRDVHPAAPSTLQHLHIIGAGILHGEKNPALQIINRDVSLEFVNVSLSASHGIEAIAPTSHLRFSKLKVTKNLGVGINYLVLNGPRDGNPLKESTIPYNVYSFVDICDINKNMRLNEKIYLYYKYDNRPVDCVKIFKTQENRKISFRLMQFNLFNSTNFSALTDSIILFDGDIFNITTKKLADIGVSEQHRLSRPYARSYTSSFESLSVRLHASGAAREYGFIAEVVSEPHRPLPYRFPPDHNVTFSDVSENFEGAIRYRSVGENPPNVNIIFNEFRSNCHNSFGNFTTCAAPVDLRLESTKSFFFYNNYLTGNQGGLRLEYTAQPNSPYALIRNNLFQGNLNNEALYIDIEVDESIFTYHYADILKNYFTQNNSPYKSNIFLSRVMANFTRNTVTTNNGKHQLEVVGFTQSPIFYQTIEGNWFYNNHARYLNERATIFASNADQHYVDNYFVNPDNDFELASMNRSHFFPHTRDLEKLEREQKLLINAKNNWWGFNETSAINSRIYDFSDHSDLIKVEYIPFHSANSSVLSGICSGGWEKIGSTCFMYIGARMSFSSAKKFCETQNSTMPFIKANHYQLTRYLYQQQYGYDMKYFKVWIQSFEYGVDECTVIVDERIKRNTCDEPLSFFCEKDPDIRVVIGDWWREPLGIAALVISSVTALLMLCCLFGWLCKSREKAKEKLQRRNSIRASIRSNRSYHGSSFASSLNDIAYKRQGLLTNPSGSQSSGLHQPIQLSNFNIYGGQNRSRSSSLESFTGRIDGVHNPLESSSSHVRQSFDPMPGRLTHHPSSPSYLEDRFADDPGLENANVDLLIRPTFDLTYENRAFRETPVSRVSNVEYSEARDWSTIGRGSTLQPPVPARRQPIPASIPLQPPGSVSPSSIGQYSRRSPSPPPTLLPQVNTYEAAASNYERLARHDMTTFVPPKIVKSSSVTSLINTAASDVTAATNLTGITSRTKQSQYLETSLDGDSVVYDYCDYPSPTAKPGDSVSLASAAQSRAPPLETAM